MKCFDAEERLNELLDCRDDISADVQLQNHLSDCDSCRQLVDEYSQVFGVNLRNSVEKSSERDTSKPARFHTAQTLIAISLMVLLFVLPATWAMFDINQSLPVASLAEPEFFEQVSETRLDRQLSLTKLSADSDIDIAAVLNIGQAFNSISLASIETEVASVETEQTRSENPWNRLIASVFPPMSGTGANQMPTPDMPTMSDASMQNMLSPLEFKQPSFKEIFRVCSNPFS